MRLLEDKGRIDFMVSDTEADPCFSTDYLFGKDRGKMFGVMVCRNTDGSNTTLRAFSGQYNGVWNVDGWVPPLFNEGDFYHVSHDVEIMIKKLGTELEEKKLDANDKDRLLKKRKSLSQKLMKEIHSLYSVSNFRGDTLSLRDIFAGNGIPTGTGDCCAPKLLNYAARNNMTPLGLSEFYWGKENRSGTKQHSLFYPPCIEKCQPLLGFMLCGLHIPPVENHIMERQRPE
jgi:hypothetical protein